MGAYAGDRDLLGFKDHGTVPVLLPDVPTESAQVFGKLVCDDDVVTELDPIVFGFNVPVPYQGVGTCLFGGGEEEFEQHGIEGVGCFRLGELDVSTDACAVFGVASFVRDEASAVWVHVVPRHSGTDGIEHE